MNRFAVVLAVAVVLGLAGVTQAQYYSSYYCPTDAYYHSHSAYYGSAPVVTYYAPATYHTGYYPATYGYGYGYSYPNAYYSYYPGRYWRRGWW